MPILNLTLFEALFLTHFISDWLFQTQWEAMNKSKKWPPLIVHSFIYSLFFIPVFYFYKVNFIYLLVLFFSHAILDNRKFEFWWLDKIKMTKKEVVGETTWIILVIGIDQVFHLAILGLIVLLQ